MKITSKTLKTRKKQLTALACRIVHARDTCCRFCGRTHGQMHASHVVPRSRGWRYAVDTANCIKMCATCHRRWHEDPVWGATQLAALCPDVYRYTDTLIYSTRPVTVGEATDISHDLHAKADALGTDV